jgi:hypothetical protein
MPDPKQMLEALLARRRAETADIDTLKDPEALDKYRVSIRQDIDPESAIPPTAPAFRPYPDVRGGPEFSRLVDTLLKRVPELRGAAKQVVHGHTDGSMKDHMYSDLPPDDFGNTNLMGVTDTNTKSIGINPNMNAPEDLMSTLSHEYAHAAGHDDEQETRGIQNFYKKAFGIKTEDERIEELYKALKAKGMVK